MSDDWNLYRTRFLVRAKQLTEPLSFTDSLGREHRGVAGDYLVKSSDGLLRIAPKEIFEDVYARWEHTPDFGRAFSALNSEPQPKVLNPAAH